MSNHNFELSIVNGLCLQPDITLKCITCPGVFSYPAHNKSLFTKAESYDYKNTHIDSVGFCNLIALKEQFATKATTKKLIEVINSFDGEEVHIIVNTPDIKLLDAVSKAKKKTKKTITQTVIIPDIPSIVSGFDKQNPIKAHILAKWDQRITKETNESNGLVLLTEAMITFYNNDIKHIVMEGIVDVESMTKSDVEYKRTDKVILYTGTLRRIFGVMNLIDAFKKVPDPSAELWICGSGDSKEAIEQAAEQDTRIRFLGLVDSQKALELQHRATILINPRTSEGEYTKYSFPSKTMEYLLSGRSVIINRLPGIPEEYYNYVYTPENESIEALTKCMIKVLCLDEQERDKRAQAGKQFIINKKNSQVQMARVLDLIRTY